MLKRLADWPLSLKMAFLVVVASLVPMAIATWSHIVGTRERLKQNAADLLAARCDQLTGQLDAFHRTYDRAPKRVGSFPEIELFCRQDPAARTASELLAMLETWPKGDPHVYGLAIVGPRGDLLLATSGVHPGASLADVDYLRAAQQGRHVISEIHVAEVAGGEPIPTIAYASPIGKPGEPPAGVVVAWVRAEALWDRMKQFNELAGPGSFAVLFDQLGIRVGHTNSEQMIFRPGGELSPDLVQALISQRRFGARTQELLADIRPFPQFDRARAETPDGSLFYGFAPVNQHFNYGIARRCNTVPWTVFYMLPEGSLNAQISSMILNKSLLAGVIGFVAVMVGLAAARALRRPLMALAGATESLAQGDLSVRLPELQRDEIGRLGDSFNKMAAQLQEQAEILRRDTDASLRERERLLGIVTGSARVGLVVVDAEYRYLFTNHAYSELFHLDENLVGQRVPDVLPAGWPQIQPRLDRAFTGERVAYELNLPPLTGETVPRCFSVVYEPRCEGERVSAVVVVVVDISDINVRKARCARANVACDWPSRWHRSGRSSGTSRRAWASGPPNSRRSMACRPENCPPRRSSGRSGCIQTTA